MQPVEQHCHLNQTANACYVHRLPPSDQVLNSRDILPLILGSLKELYSEPSENWKSAFASLMRVNSSFYGAGAALLWHTMTRVGPAFRILPWHGEGSEYKGIGVRRVWSA